MCSVWQDLQGSTTRRQLLFHRMRRPEESCAREALCDMRDIVSCTSWRQKDAMLFQDVQCEICLAVAQRDNVGEYGTGCRGAANTGSAGKNAPMATCARQPYLQSDSDTQTRYCCKGAWLCPSDWRRGESINSSSKIASRSFGLGDRSVYTNESEQWARAYSHYESNTPVLLSSRYCRASAQNQYRSGWQQPFINESEDTRCQARYGTHGIRVDRAAIYEQASDSRLGSRRMFRDGGCPVYNLETTTGNYFAEKILVHNCDLHARHLWLKTQREGLTARLEGDPDYFDAKIAGWWLWGIACWIGGEWCHMDPHSGPWVIEEDAEGMDCLVKRPSSPHGSIERRRPGVGYRSTGVHRKRPIVRRAGHGVSRMLPAISHVRGVMGSQRGAMDATDAGIPIISASRESLLSWFRALQDRLRRVRVCCGPWNRVLTPACTVLNGMTGILLDPPYAVSSGRDKHLYSVDEQGIAHEVEDWCLHHGAHPLLRIVLCGYGDTHDVLLEHGWRKYAWITNGGMGNQANGRGKANRFRERLWCSPACLTREQLSLFEEFSHDC